MVGRQQTTCEASASAPPAGAPSVADLDGRAAGENFPVALRVLPRRIRDDLHAVYGFARLADELGDAHAGDRLAALDWLDGEVDAAADGEAIHPAVARLTPLLRRGVIDVAPLRDLVEANRRDQVQHRYASFAELRDYCRLSARPVGRLVLGVFGVADPHAARLSDDVCDGLQVVEHLQDVGEDATAGRVYLPQDDLAAHGCTEDELLAASAGPALRAVVALEAERAAALLGAGTALVALLHGWARLAIVGYVAGGRAALDAIDRAGGDVLAVHCAPSKVAVAGHAFRLLRAARTEAAG